jgi:acetyl esterase/lipase
MEAFCDQARAAGLECELEVVPELRHEFPDDFPSRLPRALSWISRG